MIGLVKSLTYSYIILREVSIPPFNVVEVDFSELLDSELKSLMSLYNLKRIVLDESSYNYINGVLDTNNSIDLSSYVLKEDVNSLLEGKLGITDVAESSKVLLNGRKISLEGFLGGSVVFDGSRDVTLTTTVEGSLPIEYVNGSSLEYDLIDHVLTLKDARDEITSVELPFNLVKEELRESLNQDISKAIGDSSLKVVRDIIERDSLGSQYSLVLVLDASLDLDVTGKGATYAKYDDVWVKLSETDTPTVNLLWDVIEGKASTTVSSIDHAVLNSHSHVNKGILDGFSQDLSGNIKYNNSYLSLMWDKVEW